MNSFEFNESTLTGSIVVVELNRPRQLNSLNRKMVNELVIAWEEFDRNVKVRVIVLIGKGHAFSAGADIDEMANDNSISLYLMNNLLIGTADFLLKSRF